jgi:peptidoglycan/xylan/chitin deacetylase (PgdA/CDA1 family)
MNPVKKAALKCVVAPLSYSWPVAALTRKRLFNRVNVIYYHYVGPKVPYYGEDGTVYRLTHFGRDLKTLMRYFDFVPLRNLVTEPQARGPKPRVALTFDDGFDMINNGVMDVLNKAGVPATTFLITDSVGNRRLMWRNRLTTIRLLLRPELLVRRYNELAQRHGFSSIQDPRLFMKASLKWPLARKEQWTDELWAACDIQPEPEFLDQYKPYFTWKSLQHWIDSGHSIGLHTHTHVDCSRLNSDEIRQEITDPAQMLKFRFQLDWLAFSYPFGDMLDDAAAANLCATGVLSCLFGIHGFSRQGTPLHLLQRAYAQGHFKFEVFGNLFMSQKVR